MSVVLASCDNMQIKQNDFLTSPLIRDAQDVTKNKNFTLLETDRLF